MNIYIFFFKSLKSSLMPICLINCQLTNDIDNKKTWTLDKEKKCFPINIKALLPDLTIINLYINLAWLSVCLYPINVKTAEPIRPKFCLGLYVALGKVYENDQNLKNLCLKLFYSEILWNPQTFFVFVLYCTKRRCSQIKPQLKIEIEDGREVL